MKGSGDWAGGDTRANMKSAFNYRERKRERDAKKRSQGLDKPFVSRLSAKPLRDLNNLTHCQSLSVLDLRPLIGLLHRWQGCAVVTEEQYRGCKESETGDSRFALQLALPRTITWPLPESIIWPSPNLPLK
jgi:hypothetical protein